MSPMKNIIPAAVALAAYASAQASCRTSGTLTVTNTQDLASISACSTYSGSIAIATGAQAIALDGPKRITGDFVAVANGQLQSLEAADLEIVDGALSLPSLANLGSLSMPNLRQVDTFYLQGSGGSLLNLGFGTPGLIQVSNLTIDSTNLQDLSGIDLETAGSLAVTNNRFLSNLSMAIVNATGRIDIRGNTNGLAVALNKLTSTDVLTVNDCTSLSLNSLQNVTSSFAVISNTFASLSLPRLTLAQEFTVQQNTDLTNLTVPELLKVGSLNVNANNDLTGEINFPSLTNIYGAGNLTGTFSAVNMPKLVQVQGTFDVESTNSSIQSSCTTFNNEGSKVFEITPVCSATATASDPPTSSSGTGSAPTTSKTNAAGHYDAPEAVFTLFGALAAGLGLLL